MSMNNSAPNKKLTLDIVTDRLQNEEYRLKNVKAVLFESNALVSEKQGEAKVEIPASRTIITPEGDLNPREEIWSAFIVRK